MTPFPTDEKLRSDVEALDNTLFYLTQLEKNLHNDINITKRAASKAMEDINKAEYKKYLQVIPANRILLLIIACTLQNFRIGIFLR